MRVTIIQRPSGEAPEWVRDAWIGTSLPVVCPGAGEGFGFGVLSGPHDPVKQWWAMLRGHHSRLCGYVVNARTAVDVLAGSNPDAASWWRDHVPLLLDGRRNFLFDESACAIESADG